MGRSYHVAIADGDRSALAYLRDSLIRAGHEIIIEASTAEELISKCTSRSGESLQLIICDAEIASRCGFAAAEEVLESREVPFIILSDSQSDTLAQHATDQRAFGCLTKPVREANLTAAIQIAVRRFEELQIFRKEANSMRQALEDRKLIERAKGIVMREQNLDEPRAFTFLQNLARQKRQKLVEVARNIVVAEQAFRPP